MNREAVTNERAWLQAHIASWCKRYQNILGRVGHWIYSIVSGDLQ